MGEGGAVFVVDVAGEAEVGDDGAFAACDVGGEHHVRGFEVAVDHADAVGRAEGFGHLADEGEGFGGVEFSGLL